MPWLQVDCSRVCAVAVVQRALWGGFLYCPNNNIISLLSKSKNTYQAKLQLLKVAKRNKAALSDETLDSLIATNIQVVRRDNHGHNVHHVRHVHRDDHHQENERKAAAGKTSLWDIFRSRCLLMLMLMLMYRFLFLFLSANAPALWSFNWFPFFQNCLATDFEHLCHLDGWWFFQVWDFLY